MTVRDSLLPDLVATCLRCGSYLDFVHESLQDLLVWHDAVYFLGDLGAELAREDRPLLLAQRACQQQPTESPTCDKDNTATHGAQLEDKTQNWRTWAGSTIVRRNLRH